MKWFALVIRKIRISCEHIAISQFGNGHWRVARAHCHLAISQWPLTRRAGTMFSQFNETPFAYVGYARWWSTSHVGNVKGALFADSFPTSVYDTRKAARAILLDRTGDIIIHWQGFIGINRQLFDVQWRRTPCPSTLSIYMMDDHIVGLAILPRQPTDIIIHCQGSIDMHRKSVIFARRSSSSIP